MRASADTMPCVTVWPTPNGIADGEHEVADLQRLGIAELEHLEIDCVLQLEHGEVRARVAQHDLGLEFPPVGERHLHLGHVLDDVVVGDDEARPVDDHAGADANSGSGLGGTFGPPSPK